MSFIKEQFEKIRPLFEKGGKFEKFFYVYEAQETVFLTPNHTTKAKGAHIRDAVDMKRVMTTVIAALIPCLLFGMWNVGDLHYASIEGLGADETTGALPGFMAKFIYGAIKTLPILIVSYAVGLGIEFLFSILNQHPVSEGFLVSGLLIPMVVPPTIPLWQVAVATAFAVVLGKEVFGGTGMNLLNPALTARAFLFFAYPAQISGDKVWYALDDAATIDGFSGATILGDAAQGLTVSGYERFDFFDMFFGFIPGSIGETSAFCCLLGAGLLIATGVGSWKIIVSMIAGGLAMGWVVEAAGMDFFGTDNFYYHIVVGGFMFGTVFMATDPVSAAQTGVGKLIYGFMAGCLSIVVRTINPAYPEGVMLAILLMNVLAPLVDYFVVNANKKRRLSRATV